VQSNEIFLSVDHAVKQINGGKKRQEIKKS